jgi:TonB family protein
MTHSVRILKRAAAAILLLSCAGTALCQASADEIQAQLKGRPLFLRGQWRDNKLKFDLSGNLAAAVRVPFTLSGIDVQSVKQKGDHLQITGRRVGLTFAPDGSFKRVALDGHVSLEITGPPGSDFGPAVRAIFAPDLANMLSQLPLYWGNFGKDHFTSGPAVAAQSPIFQDRTPAEAAQHEAVAPRIDPLPINGKPMHTGGSVRAPKVLKTSDPDYTEEARSLKISGNVALYLVVNADGTPGHVQIVHPLGLGLDESAVNAATKYVFEPARLNGLPVMVDLYIDVNFQIF